MIVLDTDHLSCLEWGSDESAVEIARERGSRYTQFLGRARDLLRKSNRSMHVHLHTEAFRPDPVHGGAGKHRLLR